MSVAESLAAMTPAELIAVITARLDEDERAALAADVKQRDPVWKVNPVRGAWPRTYRVRSSEDSRPIATVTDVAGDGDADPTGIVDGESVAEHIARHDPARVLADVDAGRRTLVRCEEELLSGVDRVVHFAEQTLRDIARPYLTQA